MTPFEKAVEKAIEAHGQHIAEGHRRVNDLAKESLDQSRRIAAQERLILALTAVLLKDEDDPLAALDNVRELAVRALDGEGLVEMREHIELTLTKVEGFLIRQP